MRRPPILLFVCALVGLTVSGCVGLWWDSTQFDAALKRIDNSIRAIDEAMAKITRESASWREALAKLEKDLKEDAQDVLANEVKNIGASAAADLGDQLKIGADFIDLKLKDNLKALRQALEEAREEIQEAKKKKDEDGIKRALDKLATIKVYHDPVVTAFIPGHVQIVWDDLAQTSYKIKPALKDTPLIEVRGWGFERPPGEETPRFSLEVIDATGKKVRDLPSSAIFLTDRYKLQIKLDAPGMKFSKGDHALVFVCGPHPTDRRYLPINHVIPDRPPPPPPERVVSVAGNIQTRGDDRDGGIVILTLKDGGTTLWSAQYPEFPGFNDPSDTAIAFNLKPNVAVPANPLLEITLTEEGAKDKNIIWRFSIKAVFTTTHNRRIVFERNDIILDTRGYPKPKTAKAGVNGRIEGP